LQSNYAALPAGRIAVLPLSGGGAGRYFAAETGLDQKWDMLTEQQLVNSNWFNPANYPMAFFLGGEDYVDTVNTTGDGKAAVTSYLANGGTLVILPNGAWPFFYGYGPNDQPGPPDPLLTAYGLPIESLEQPAPGTFMQLYTNQTVVQSVPVSFPYPPGDQRLRSFNMIAIPPADYYEHFIRAVDTNGNYYGDVAAYVSFGTGPANGGNLLYVWDTLLEGPQGQDVLADTVTWILNAVFPTSNPPSGPTLNPQNYGSWMHVSFSGYDQGGTLSNFPALVRLGTNLPGFSYEQFASPTGGDLRFTDASGSTLIPHEIDEWNTNGTSYVWVQVPALSGPTNSIWAYWGNAAAANPLAWSTNGAVWATNYNLVWHLKEGGFPYADSAQQHPAAAGSSPASTTGVVGKGCLFSGSQFLDAGTVKLGAQFTLSAWVNVAANANDIQVIWANASPGYKPGFALYVNSFLTGDKELRLDVDDGTTGGGTASSTNAVGFGQWHLITAAISQWSGVGTLYVDGTAVAGGSYLGTALTDFPLDADLNLGCFTNGASQFNGTMDEVRVQSSMASPNWVWASWMTVASNAVFSSYASVTPNPPVILPSINATGRNNGLLLSWPASGVGYALYMTTNLAAPSSWSLVTNAPVLVTSNNVTQWQLPVSTTTSAAGYYQLKAQ
ncbi:MAG: DUF2341 domain-containing protein, partial [Verrucomicrobiota bacterium]